MTGPGGRYDRDTYFLETLDALTASGIDPESFGHRHALLLLKPDAAVTGAMRPAVLWLLDHGYGIVDARAVQFTPLHIRALWYFNWHRATPERRRLADRLAGLSPALVVVVTHPDESVPVSVRLTADKGPADPAQREPGQLRHTLGAGTYMLNMVHTPDNADDVLRELSIYFGEPLLGEVIAGCSAGADASPEAIRLADEIERGVGRRSGDLTAAQDGLWSDLRGSGMTQRPDSGEQWLAVLDDADRRGAHVDIWFRTVIESAYLPMHRG